MFFSWKEDYNPGDGFRGGAVQRLGDRPYSALRAIDVATGERRWEYRYASQSWAGVLSTGSGLVFAGGSGNLIAFDAKSGKNLWHFQTGSSLYAGAITYMEAAMLAPNAEVSIFPWKEPKERIPLAVRQIRSFLRAHRPGKGAS